MGLTGSVGRPQYASRRLSPLGGWVVGVGSGRSVVGWVVARCWVLRERARASLLHADHRKHLPCVGGCVRVGSSVA